MTAPSGTPQGLGTFDYAVRQLLGDPHVAGDGSEGDYTDDPRDDGNRGGKATNYGLTQPFYDRYRREVGLPPRPVREASEDEARSAYYRLIWVEPRTQAGAVSDNCPQAGLVYFDGCVNHGGWMIGVLQGAIGVMRDYWFGPRSLAALRQQGGRDAPLAIYLLDRRRSLYLGHHDFSVYGDGWRNRLTALARAAGLPAWHWH